MKRVIISSLGSIVIITVMLLTVKTEEVKATGMDYRHFFQSTSTYDDGAMTRWTGCVNTGGMCWSESTVVADCSFDGGQTWANCNNNLVPGGGD